MAVFWFVAFTLFVVCSLWLLKAGVSLNTDRIGIYKYRSQVFEIWAIWFILLEFFVLAVAFLYGFHRGIVQGDSHPVFDLPGWFVPALAVSMWVLPTCSIICWRRHVQYERRAWMMVRPTVG